MKIKWMFWTNSSELGSISFDEKTMWCTCYFLVYMNMQLTQTHIWNYTCQWLFHLKKIVFGLVSHRH